MSSDPTAEAEMDGAINAIRAAQALLADWKASPMGKPYVANGMLAATRILIETAATASRAAAAIAAEAAEAAEGLGEHGGALLVLAEDLEDHCAYVETEAWSCFTAMVDES